jgi:hypothetical protein
MATQSGIAMPESDQVFEQSIAVLFRGIMCDPNTKQIAKSGKSQKGIDVFGRRDRVPGQPVGVQCKLRATKANLFEVQAQAEFFIVTTANDDVADDKIATKLWQEQKILAREIDNQIWGWNTLQDRIG